MISAKKEFLRARREIHEEGFATTIFYRNKVRFNLLPDTAAYVMLCHGKSTIILMKNRYSYADLILYLGHEYGHVMDYRRWGACRRWRLRSFMPNASEKRKLVPTAHKIAYLKTEVIADRYIPVFLKKFNIDVDYDPLDLDSQMFSSAISLKYELMYGNLPEKSLENQWMTMARSKRIKLDPKWLYNFKKLLK